MKKVMVFGTFDMLHPGHIHFLKEAKKYSDYLTVVVARDKTVEKIKNKKPVHTEKERMHAIEKSNIVDKVMLGSDNLSFQCIHDEKPDIICLGYDQNSQEVEKEFPKIRFFRISAFHPEKYKSSKMRQK